MTKTGSTRLGLRGSTITSFRREFHGDTISPVSRADGVRNCGSHGKLPCSSNDGRDRGVPRGLCPSERRDSACWDVPLLAQRSCCACYALWPGLDPPRPRR
jgi:hypothetical protein